jgi:ketosteroid isomerase-like protein
MIEVDARTPLPANTVVTANKLTVQRYIDGFNTSDHAQILSCLTDDIRWTVFGAYRIQGKEAYDAHIESPEFDGPPQLTIVSIVEENDVVMAELTLVIRRKDGSTMRAAMGEVFVMDDELIKERRAYLVELKENDYR